MYGIVETLFEVFGPLLRQALFAVAPVLPPNFSRPFISTRLTAFVLVAYPVVGAFVSASVVMLFFSFRHRALSKADSATLWSAVGSLTLGIAFGVNALFADQAFVALAAVVPIALALLGLRSAWRCDWRSKRLAATRPLTLVLTLVGAAFILQPRPYMSPFIAMTLATGYTAVVLFLGTILRRPWNPIQFHPRFERRLPPSWASVVVLSLAVLGLTLLTNVRPLLAQAPSHAPDRRPNIVLITMDAVRADHLSVYGYRRDTTPNLDAWPQRMRRCTRGQSRRQTGRFRAMPRFSPARAREFMGRTTPLSRAFRLILFLRSPPCWRNCSRNRAIGPALSSATLRF
jgi:glucan phosphoethanolaminetransferase (alkaline phosphatase superfamily)